MKLTLEVNMENVGNPDIPRYEEIVNALIRSGGLSGIRGGKTIIHFDAEGTFQGVQLDYWPFRKRKL